MFSCYKLPAIIKNNIFNTVVTITGVMVVKKEQRK